MSSIAISHENHKPVTVRAIQDFKTRKEKITMLTAYDFMFAKLADQAGIEMVLVGDSLGMVIQGLNDTLGVTVEQMIYHTQAVKRGLKRAFLISDMPFLSFQNSKEHALENAGRLIKEGGAHAVKLEGGEEFFETIQYIRRASIPVMGHLGLTPQSIHDFGGFIAQGKNHAQAKKLLEDAKSLEEAGCFSIVLESIPEELAAEITNNLHIPTIGIGAGSLCDGQVLVCYDLLHLNADFLPKFVKPYTHLHQVILDAYKTYAAEVKQRVFPSEEHRISLPNILKNDR